MALTPNERIDIEEGLSEVLGTIRTARLLAEVAGCNLQEALTAMVFDQVDTIRCHMQMWDDMARLRAQAAEEPTT